MIATRIFNNNAVAVLLSNGNEAVVLGAGLGFKKKVGDSIDEKNVEKIYYIQSELQNKFQKILNSTSKEYLAISEAILKKAQKFNYEPSTVALLALTEHISFAVERWEKGAVTPNLMLHEIESFYPNEYNIGLWALDHIEAEFGVKLGKDEVGYIALHIINSGMNNNSKVTVDTLKFVSGTLALIEKVYKIKVDENLFDKNRLVTHLKYLAQRVFTNCDYKDNEINDIYDYLIVKNTNHKVFIQQFIYYVEEEFGYTLGKPELAYILIHITKFLEN